MSNVNTARSTLGSLFGVVTTTANTASGLLDSVNNGANMLNTAIDSMAKDQADRIALHRKNYRADLINRSTIERGQQELEITSWKSQSKEHSELFDKIHADLSSVFED